VRPKYLKVGGSLRGKVRRGCKRGKRVVMLKVEGNLVARWRGVSQYFIFLVFGLLCHHTASNSITPETHTSGAQ
jgi:hypothetical protein